MRLFLLLLPSLLRLANMELLACTGEITSSPLSCSGDWLSVPYLITLEQLDPVLVGQSFGAGFTVVAVFAVTGLSVGACMRFIKRGF